MNPDTIFIAGANQGVGFELISYILSQPKPPKFLFAGCKDPTATDTKFLKATAEKYNCVKIIPFDATIDGDIDSAVATTEMTMGADEGLNLLINNAGMVDSTGSDLASQTRQTMCSHFETNAAVPVLMTQKLLPLLRKAADQKRSLPLGCGRAAIINMSFQFGSIQSSMDCLKSYHYRAARAALNTVTTLMAMELKEYGILVAAIHPGWADTAATEESAEEDRLSSMNNIWSTIMKMTEESAGMMHNYDGMVLPW